MTTYTALSNRIRAAETRQELAKREEQITRHYHAGTVTASELSRLDGKIMEMIFFILATLAFAALYLLGLTRYALPSLLTAAMLYLFAVLVMV